MAIHSPLSLWTLAAAAGTGSPACRQAKCAFQQRPYNVLPQHFHRQRFPRHVVLISQPSLPTHRTLLGKQTGSPQRTCFSRMWGPINHCDLPPSPVLEPPLLRLAVNVNPDWYAAHVLQDILSMSLAEASNPANALVGM
jgi:hypothetical protein